MFKSFFSKTETINDDLDNINKNDVKVDEVHPPISDVQDDPLSVRVAVYDSLVTAPRTFDISSTDFARLIDQIASQVYALSHEKGGNIPYILLREAVENLIHANFKNAVITVMPDGNTIRISDQGPGIPDKTRVFTPGFTTATENMRKHIKGVGSGLPIVNESLKLLGGHITIEDNLKDGAVITLYLHSAQVDEEVISSRKNKQDLSEDQSNQSELHGNGANVYKSSASNSGDMIKSSTPEIDKKLSNRQKSVFLLIAENGEIGPSTVGKELDISLSTAHRDLVTLEDYGLISCLESGKRKVTDRGLEYLGYIFK